METLRSESQENQVTVYVSIPKGVLQLSPLVLTRPW